MAKRWRIAFLSILCTASLATGGTTMVQGATTARVPNMRLDGYVKKPVRVGVDEKAYLYVMAQDGLGRVIKAPVPGKEVAKLTKAVEEAMKLFSAPKVHASDHVLGTFLHTADEDKPKPVEKEEPAVEVENGSNGALVLPVLENMKVPPSLNAPTVIQARAGVKVIFRAGYAPKGPGPRVLLLQLSQYANWATIEVQMNQAQTAALLRLLRNAPPTYRALLAKRQRAKGN